MAKRKEMTHEEVQTAKVESDLKSLRSSYVPAKPTRSFKPGERVKVGNLKDVIVVETFDDDTLVHVSYTRSERSGDLTDQHGVWAWTEVFHFNIFVPQPMSERNDYNISQMNTDIDSLLSRFYHAGVTDNQEYQRDYCWTVEQKRTLIDSIMQNVDIGKFTFVKRDYGFQGPLYEIVDGKQRLKAIRDFYEGRFMWRGCTYADLNPTDQHHFDCFKVVLCDTTELSKKDALRLFLKLNVCGVPQSTEHLEKVSKMWKESE